MTDSDVRDRIIAARVNLILKHSFFGNLATRLKLVNADDWCKTAATDSVNLFYNIEFVSKLSHGEVVFLVAHEIMHCILEHGDRRGSRDAAQWNVACDYAINGDLRRHGIGEFITTGLYDVAYEGKSADEIYELLNKKSRQEIEKLASRVLDHHMDGTDDENNGGMSEEDRKAILDEFRDAVINAAADGVGNIPASILRHIKCITEPVMNWRELLSCVLSSHLVNDVTWMKPSRRSWHMDVMLPGVERDEHLDIVIAIDTSGSISSGMLNDFLSEVIGIMGMYSSFNIMVLCFDTRVHNPCCYDVYSFGDMGEYEMAGGGGTDFSCVYDYLKSENIVPKRLVWFTDGYSNDWGDSDYCDVVWILHGSDAESIVVPYGVSAIYS